MRVPMLATIIPTTLLLCSQVVRCINFDEYDYILKEISDLDTLDGFESIQMFEKRDDNSTNDAVVSQYTTFFQTLGASGLLPEIINEISSSPEQTQNLVTYLEFFLSGDGGNETSTEGLSINLNMTQILNSVMSSGIIQSTAQYLLVNDASNQFLGNFLGEVLGAPKNVWVGWLLLGLGDGHDLTVDWIADLIVNTTSKANTNEDNMSEINVEQGLPVTPKGQNYDIVIDVNGGREGSQTNYARDDGDDNEYAGSFDKFLNNAINTILQSNIVQSNANDIIVALNQSGIVGPLVLDILKLPNLSNLTNTIASTLYKNGALDGLDLESTYEDAKQKNILSDALEYILTDGYWSPPLAKLFRRIEDTGAYQRLQDNMYGPHKRL
ncbi:hypothetical protein KGF56_003485 [Candida oxycetoniae]|uniref:Uncharacterized protein n=1 Tax=Candida oxycetoniae TaxID=497107 RepID=A0AAI9WWX9_9ASCO|nr:uncharacterized protein KGF56_003485 [Candida oxycetoniae]KAI3403667.1 hypothetical protein KGF56_003485 [Candida oxycetoniae]